MFNKMKPDEKLISTGFEDLDHCIPLHREIFIRLEKGEIPAGRTGGLKRSLRVSLLSQPWQNRKQWLPQRQKLRTRFS